MASSIKFGISAPTNLAVREPGPWTPEDMIKVVQRAEELGYDTVSVADHVFLPEYWRHVIPGEWIDPFAVIDYLAARTSRIRLMISCIVVPYRLPFTVAKWAATIDQLSQGRFILGVVPGYLKEEFETFKLPLEERSEMTDEFIRIMQAVWTSKSASFRGKYYQFEGIDIVPKCYQKPHVPVWMGGSSKRAIRRAVELGSGWVPVTSEMAPQDYRQQYAAELEGKTLPTTGTSLDDLRRDIAYAREVAGRLGKPFDLEVMPLIGSIQLSGPPVAADLRPGRRTNAARATFQGQGSPERVVAELKRYVEAGATGFFMHLTGPTVDESFKTLERFAREVIPAFR